MSRCRSCHAEVAWIVTLSGRRLPVEGPHIVVKRTPGGDTTVVTDQGEVVIGVRVASGGYRGREVHFARCPHADRWRKSR